jgi:pimeloyl-ACP methyl ester carboxylesterase
VTAERGHLELDGRRLEYSWFGDAGAQARTIVLLHEGLGSVAMWKDFPHLLAQQTGARVLAYSRTGYGTSSGLTGRREPDYMHIEGEVVLPALLEALDIRRPILFGHSDGGSIALIYAGKHPGRARSLILEAPHVFVEPVTVSSIAAAKTTYETTDLARKLGRYHWDADAAFWGWNDIWLDSRFLAWNIESYLPAVDCPILMIQGRQDEYGTVAQLEAISRQAAGETAIVMLDNCGHSPHRDQTELTIAAVNRHLSAHD